MAENYGTLEGTLDEHGVLSGEMSDRATLEGEIQFGSGGGGVLDVFQNGQSVVQGRYAYVTVPTFLRELRSDDYHNTVTSLEMQIWNGKADPSDIPENITDLSDVAVDNIQNGQVLKWDATQEKFVNADESGGGGDVTDVKVDGTSVVDPTTKEANIDLTDYAKTEDIPTDLADLSDDATHRLVTDTEKDTWDNKSDFSGDYNDLDNLPTLGTAAAKNSTALITSGSTDVAEAGAVREAIDSAVASSYHHAGTKTCVELVSSLLVRANEGNVYNMTDSGVTTADFIEGAGKPIEEGANVGIAKIAENTYKFDLLSGFIDTSTFIEKSATSGLVRNDGSIDTSDYALESEIPDISGKADKVLDAVAGDFPILLANGNVGNSGKKPSDFALKSEMSVTDGTGTDADKTTIQLKNGTSATVLKSHQDITGKADKVTGATENNFAALDANGNLKDSGHKHSDYLTQHQDISGKADKVSSATNGNLAGLNGSGNPTDSGWNGAKDTTSISGNPISISGLKANQLAVNPIITLEPIQAGSGTPSPSNIRAISGYDKIEVSSCGKNLFDGTYSKTAYYLNDSGVETSSAAFNISQYIRVKASASYYFSNLNPGSSSACICWYNNAKEFISAHRINEGFTDNSPANACYVRASVSISATNVCINEGSSAITYVPYVKTTDLSESLGQTVYGGSLDVRTGVLSGDATEYVLTGNEVWTAWNSGSYYAYCLSVAGVSNSGTINVYNAEFGTGRTVNSIYSGTSGIAVTGNYVYISGDIYSALSSLVGKKIIYKRATPFTIQLTPHEISLLKDYAYVSTNGTSIALDYHNGELASLGDVSQLGETVNELGEYIGANNKGTDVDLSLYTSQSSSYQFPKDGYIVVYGGSATSGNIYVALLGNDNGNFGGIYMNITGTSQMQTTFVKKGMRAYLGSKTASASNLAVVYRPLV